MVISSPAYRSIQEGPETILLQGVGCKHIRSTCRPNTPGDDIVRSIWKHIAAGNAADMWQRHISNIWYDGDELNFTILLDNDLAEEFKTLRPFYNITSVAEPYGISDHLTLLSPSYNILANYLMEKTPKDKPCGLANQLTYVEVQSNPYRVRLYYISFLFYGLLAICI